MKREVVEFAKMVAWFLVLFFIVNVSVVGDYEVQGNSMFPTLVDGERILVFKLPAILSGFSLFDGIDPVRTGDLVVFDSPVEPGRRYVKRVIAKGAPSRGANDVLAGSTEASAPGVRVLFDKGTVYVDNRRIDEPYLRADAPVCEDSRPEVALQPGQYYVLGDNRAPSNDSRNYGPVDKALIIGTPFLCFWPLDHIRLIRPAP